MKMPLNMSLKTEIIPLAFVTATVATVICFYNNLPEKVASHWNFAGQADGWSSNTFHGIFFPLLIITIYALMLIMPMIDPKKENYEKFARTYHSFKALLIGTLFVIYLTTTLYNLGYNVDVRLIITATIGILLISIGFYLKNIKENWFIGVKTPWTISSPEVWEKTHKFSSWLFIFLGLSIIIAPYLPEAFGISLIIIGALGVSIGSYLYSYLAFNRIEKRSKK